MLQPRRVLITGALGFIGNALLKAYQQQGVEAIGIDLRGDGGAVRAGDIAVPEAWEHLLDGCDAVIHTAALVSNAVPDAEMWRVNVLATHNLVAAAVRRGVRRFVHLSSIVVYGFEAAGEITEERPVHAAGGSYVTTKLASEYPVLNAQARGQIQATIIRPGDVYGPGSRPWIVLPLELIRKNQFLLPAGGKGYFRPIYVDDLVRGIQLAVASEQAVGETFNLSCEGHVTAREYFSYHFRWLGKRGPIVVPTWLALGLAGAFERMNHWLGRSSEASVTSVVQLATRSWFSIEKAKRVLGWQPEVSLEEGMKRCEEWAREKRMAR